MPVETLNFYDGLFPVDDGIGLEVVDGVDPTYDLRNLLDPTMRERPSWDDFAAAASAVLFELFERHRRALDLSWTPQDVVRVFKVMSLKMLGLDYRDDSMTDDDYDRVLDSISQFNASKGPPHFVRYMGFMRDVPLELVKLWSRNYREFYPGPSMKKTPVYAGGDEFPTPHVGILYEKFLAPQGVDVEKTRELFYKVAPINLVLDWIAWNITLSIGTLYVGVNFYKRSEVTLAVEWNPRCNLYLSTALVSRLDVTLATDPPDPWETLPSTLGAAVIGLSEGSAVALSGDMAWSSHVDDASLSITHAAGFALRTRQSGALEWGSYPVRDDWPGGAFVGDRLAPVRLNYVRGARTLAGTSWQRYGADVEQGAYAPDGVRSARVSTSTAGGTLRCLVESALDGATSWVVKQGTSRYVALGKDGGITSSDPEVKAVFDLQTKTVVSAPDATRAGVDDYGAGFYRLWARLAGKDVLLHPAVAADGSAAEGYVDSTWVQAEDAPWPSDLIDTGATRSGRSASTRVFKKVTSLRSAQGWGYVGFYLDQPEWRDAAVTLLHAKSTFGLFAQMRLSIETDGSVSLVGPDGGVVSLGTVLPRTKKRVAFSWGGGHLKLFAEGASASAVVGDWPTNFNLAAVGHDVGATPLVTLSLGRFAVVGSLDVDSVPSAAALAAMTV